MKPPFHRTLLAHTAGLSAALGAVGALAGMFANLHAEGALVMRAGVWIWILMAALPVACIGWFAGLILLWGVILGRFAARVQGWPFAVGERVWILSGPHRGAISKVYEAWPERGQVRVDLGPEAMDRFRDVFCAVAVCRAPDPVPGDPPLDNPSRRPLPAPEEGAGQPAGR